MCNTKSANEETGLAKNEPVVKPTADDGDNPKEKTRGAIAKCYVNAFFIVILIVFLVGALPIDNQAYKNTRDMLVTVSGILSGPLGFIIGYYFKSGEGK